MNTDFYRMKRLPPYVIAEVNSMRHAARQAGEDIIDLGMGNPDQPPPQHVIDTVRGCAEARCAWLLTVERHSRPSPRSGKLLWPPLRRGA